MQRSCSVLVVQEIRLESMSQKKQEAARADLLGHMILAAPVFLLYHLGLLVSPQAANGADLVTRLLGYLAGMSGLAYLLVMLILTVLYVWYVRRLRRSRRFDARRFPQVLVEATVYAVFMGPVASLLVSKMYLIGSSVLSMGPVDRLVASAGAGFYEELIFRLVGIGLITGWLEKRRLKKWLSVLIAVLVTSLVFSAMHYLGPGSDTFSMASFLFRLVLGAMLGAIFVFRGFATAVYAHFLYDLYVMFFLVS